MSKSKGKAILPANDPASVQRGDYTSSVFSKTLFVAGRLASGPLQYALIRAHPLSSFGIASPPKGGSISLLGHAYPRLPFMTALMPTILGLKHSLWISCWGRERMTLTFALFGIIADGVYESVTSLVFTAAAANPLFSEQQFYIGNVIFYTGMAIELAAELHRAYFKSRPENKGKVCISGLWSVTRHINYTANVIFGFGVGLATGGLGYSVATAGMYLSNFIFNAIPGIEAYCKEKYGQQWEDYVERVPSQLIPGIYWKAMLKINKYHTCLHIFTRASDT